VSIKQGAKRAVRQFHLRFLDRGLPNKLALLLHTVSIDQLSVFEKMLQTLTALGYRFTSPDDFTGAAAGERVVLLTFDDNFKDWTGLLETMGRWRAVATFYVNTLPMAGSADEIRNYYDRIDQPPMTAPLTADGLLVLRRGGHVIGSHTHSHRSLMDLSVAAAISEVTQAKTALEQLLGESVDHFAYPYGRRRDFSSHLAGHVLGLGIHTIATGRSGLLHSPTPNWLIHRTAWKLSRPADYNLASLKLDGSAFDALTGRSAVGLEHEN
jgi:peptidoglycan/xylan/chitin deacetylase (PgdA/CDA1 family)